MVIQISQEFAQVFVTVIILAPGAIFEEIISF